MLLDELAMSTYGSVGFQKLEFTTDNGANIDYLNFISFTLLFLSRSSSQTFSNANNCIRIQEGMLIFIL